MDRAQGARVEAYGIARVRGRAVPLAAPRLAAPRLAAPCLAAPPRVSPRRSPRRAAPPAAPLLSLPWRFYTSRPLAWRFCTLKARAARNNAAAMEPACRNAAPPSFAHRIKSRTTPRRIRGDASTYIQAFNPFKRAICRHGLHGQPPPLSFVALRTLICVEGAPGSRSSQPQAAPWHAGARFVALGALMCVMCHMPVLRCRQAANT